MSRLLTTEMRRALRRVPVLLLLARSLRTGMSTLVATFGWHRLSRQGQIKLELGSGAKAGRGGWTTVDLYGADICHDLRRGIRLQSGCVDAIYTSHMLEHIPYSALVSFIAECRRVLRDGGSFSVCVPNAGSYIDAYINNRIFKEKNLWYPEAKVDTGSFIDQVNYIAYMGGEHAYMFDEENLVNTIRKAGFTSVELRPYDGTMDLKERDFESIYAIAIK